MAERRSHKALVAGSNPAEPTKKFERFNMILKQDLTRTLRRIPHSIHSKWYQSKPSELRHYIGIYKVINTDLESYLEEDCPVCNLSDMLYDITIVVD